MTTVGILGIALPHQTVHRLAQPETWYGLSGAKVTGDAVAAHLRAAAALMKRESWDPQLCTPGSLRTLYYALVHTSDDGLGDSDSRYVAEILLEAVLTAASGAPYVDYEAWTNHSARTLDDILRACQAAAAVAHAYGPGALAGHPQVEPGRTC
ncbi:hypothetical protein [Streptomyces sp. NPDC093109]|uniref:DUF6197 family protein n=1 Tax=Streptomyces sp. NPDC093109 TaxID=3154977 RepID=UPI0034503C03